MRMRHTFPLATLVSAAALGSTGVQAAEPEVTLELGYASAESGTYHVLATEFERYAEELTDGAVDIKLRCCTQLSTEDEAFRGLQLGTLDLYIITHSNVSPHYAPMDVFTLPYVFEDRAHGRRVVDGEIGDAFAERLYRETGVHLLAWGALLQRDFYNTERPIHEPADMNGLKIRVPRNEVMIATHEAFGAAPTPLAWSETAAALQTGTVQGGDNGTTLIKSQKFYELADHLAILGHFSYFNPIFASDRALGELSEAQRSAIMEAGRRAGAAHAEIMSGRVAEVREFLGDEGGMQVTRPNRTPFIELARGVQDEFAARKSQAFRDLLDQVRNAADN